MSQRRKSRKHAIDVLYAAELRDEPVTVVLDEMRGAGWQDHGWFAYTREAVVGVSDELDALDERIESTARNWTLDRMPALDRAILRLAVWEFGRGDIPSTAVISEAVELAGELSTAESGAFINGVLAAIAAEDGASVVAPAAPAGDEHPIAEGQPGADRG